MQKKLVVVTGASSGIGEATARAFQALGHPLLLLARRTDRLAKLASDTTMVAGVDVTDLDAFRKALDTAAKRFGEVDCLVNNAGVMLLGQVATQDPAEWRRMLDVNVWGLLNGIHLVLKSMRDRQGGTIVNISSVAGRKTFPNHAVYCGTKFAVHAITENLREEVAGSNVRLVVIAPGAVETELLSHTTSSEIIDGYQGWKDDIGGAIASDDIARAIVYAYSQPQNVCVREIVIAPTRQGP